MKTLRKSVIGENTTKFVFDVEDENTAEAKVVGGYNNAVKDVLSNENFSPKELMKLKGSAMKIVELAEDIQLAEKEIGGFMQRIDDQYESKKAGATNGFDSYQGYWGKIEKNINAKLNGTGELYRDVPSNETIGNLLERNIEKVLKQYIEAGNRAMALEYWDDIKERIHAKLDDPDGGKAKSFQTAEAQFKESDKKQEKEKEEFRVRIREFAATNPTSEQKKEFYINLFEDVKKSSTGIRVNNSVRLAIWRLTMEGEVSDSFWNEVPEYRDKTLTE